MSELSRRSLFAGIGALIAAPAIVRAASLMPVRAIVPARRNIYLTFAEISREAIYQFRYSNTFIANIDRQWTWGGHVVLVREPSQLRIRLPQPEWTEQVYPIVRAA